MSHICSEPLTGCSTSAVCIPDRSVLAGDGSETLGGLHYHVIQCHLLHLVGRQRKLEVRVLEINGRSVISGQV